MLFVVGCDDYVICLIVLVYDCVTNIDYVSKPHLGTLELSVYLSTSRATHTTMSRNKVKDEDPEYDELADDVDDDDYDLDDEDHGFHMQSAIKPPNSHPVSCYDLYTQIQEGEFISCNTTV